MANIILPAINPAKKLTGNNSSVVPTPQIASFCVTAFVLPNSFPSASSANLLPSMHPYLPAALPPCFPAALLSCLPAFLLLYPTATLVPAFLPPFLPTCLHPYLPALTLLPSFFLPTSPSPFLPLFWSLSRQPAFLFQYAFSIKDEDAGEVMIALMQEDTRIDRDEGGTNLSIGYFIMKVTCAKKPRLSVFSAWYFLP